MTRIENHCCSCATPGYPCLGRACPLREVEVVYCDRCRKEIDPDKEVHHVSGDDLCCGCYEDDVGDE
jgi:hypothetical protein